MLRLSNVGMKFSQKEVLKDVSFSVNTGEIVGLVGPNGIGKTTIVKILAGLLIPTSGEVETEGLAALIEQPVFFQDMTGRENIEYYFDIDTTNDTDFLFDLKEYIDKPVKTYSLGMKQKLAIYGVFNKKTNYILLDEPTNSLDITSREEFKIRVKQAKENGKGVLVISHNYDELQNICDRVLVLNDGVITNDIKQEENRTDYYYIKIDGTFSEETILYYNELDYQVMENTMILKGDKETLGKSIRNLSKDYIIVETGKYCTSLEMECDNKLKLENDNEKRD